MERRGPRITSERERELAILRIAIGVVFCLLLWLFVLVASWHLLV